MNSFVDSLQPNAFLQRLCPFVKDLLATDMHEVVQGNLHQLLKLQIGIKPKSFHIVYEGGGIA